MKNLWNNFVWPVEKDSTSMSKYKLCKKTQLSDVITSITPSRNARLARDPGPSTVRPSSSGPQEALYISIWSLL